MVNGLRARIVYARPATAARLRELAPEVGLHIESAVSVSEAGALSDFTGCSLVLFEQIDDNEAAAARVYSLASAHPDLLVVAVVPHPRLGSDRTLLRARAFDVVDDGPGLQADLEHTVAAASRVVELYEQRALLSSDLAHQDKLSALGVLSAGVSHEINNPCAAILTNMSVLREQLEAVIDRPPFNRVAMLDAFSSEWIESIGDCISAANRIHSIVKTLNIFSRKVDVTPISVDVNEEIRTVLRLIGKEVRFNARFDVRYDPQLPRILAPPNTITQVVTNLVVNALQALENANTPSPKIWIATAHDDDHLMLEIGDNGPGMSADVVSRIFDPFFTTKAVGKGTGLGLSITRQLVQKMGGEILVESEPGEGTRFEVVVERTHVFEANPRLELRTPPSSDRLRVLLLDDEELVLRSMQRSLAAHFECLGMPRAQAALTALEADHDFDVVVTDVVMPEMNGIEFYSELQTHHPDLALRTLFISGGITSQMLHERVTDTGRPCLAKPIDLAELVQSIRRIGRPFEELG